MRFFTSSILFISTFLFVSTVNAADVKEWTVLVFENGNNNLDRYITADVNEMESVGSSDRVNIVAQWGSLSRGKVVRLKIQKDNDKNNVTSPVLQDLGRSDMGDWHQVVEFVKWGIQNFPAKKYFLIIADHGAGWRASGGKIVSHDDNTHNGIKLHELSLMAHNIKKILGKNLDLMGFDACLMAMAEVAAEFWGMADFLLASQEVEPGYGWAYQDALPFFHQYPTSTASALGQAVIQAYVKSYQGGSQGREEVTLSLTDLSKLDIVAKDLRDFAVAVNQKASSDQKIAISNAFASSQSFYNSDYIDLQHFFQIIRQDKSLSAVFSPQWLAAAEANIQKAVLVNGVTQKYANSHGLSIWGPSKSFYTQYSKDYARTRFDRGTKWSSMLTLLYQNMMMRQTTFKGARN